MNPAERVVGLLAGLLARRERDHAPARTSRVLGRYEDGTERIQRTDATCVTRGGPDNHYAGTTVLSPSLAPFHRAGSALGTSQTIGAGALWVERLEPAELRRGQTIEVTAVGRGFDTATWIDFLRPPADDLLAVNQDLLVESVTFVDSETLHLQVEVSSTAVLYTAAPITFGRQPGATSMSTSGEPRQAGLKGYKAEAYAVQGSLAAPRFYGFLAPSELVACIYASDGSWVADRGTLGAPAELPSAENGVLIAVDAGGAVGVGALAWRSGNNELTVWDVDGGQSYTYEGTEAAYCSPPVYHEGRLFWVEFPEQETEPDTNEAPLFLRRASCDLSDPATVATAIFSAGLISWDLGPTAKVAAANGAMLFASEWLDNINGEVRDFAGARFTYGPSGASTQSGAGIDLAQGLPAADGGCVGLASPQNTLRALTSTLGDTSTERWPTTGAWALAEGFGLALNAAVSADGTLALLYGFVEDSPSPVVIEAPAAATSGNPTSRVPVADHPVHGFPPQLLFFLETA